MEWNRDKFMEWNRGGCMEWNRDGAWCDEVCEHEMEAYAWNGIETRIHME